MIARSLELMPPHGQKSGVREAGVMVVYVLYTWGIYLDYEIKHIKLIRKAFITVCSSHREGPGFNSIFPESLSNSN